jgi:hypothetical protein
VGENVRERLRGDERIVRVFTPELGTKYPNFWRQKKKTKFYNHVFYGLKSPAYWDHEFESR